MAKLIDPEVLKKELDETFRDRQEISYKEAEKLIRSQTDTGLTQVVRCRNCMEYIVETGRCHRWGIHVRDDTNFCGYGLHLKGYNE